MKDAVYDFIMLLDFVEETPLDILIIDKYNEPSDVKRLKLKMMTAVANESNTGEMVTELCEYAAYVDIPSARGSIWVVVKMVLQQYDVNVVVVPLIQFLEMERGYFISKALMFATIINSSVRVMPWDPGKSMLLWLKLFVNVFGKILFQYMVCLIGYIADSQSLPAGLYEVWQQDKELEEALDIRKNEQGEV
ncbi:beta-adaptin A-like protein, partial [Trifolium medium]|nr:beta-adaptin A-like protein [Trifolium medium]